ELSDAADPASRTFAARYVLEGEAASAPLGSTVTIGLLTKQNSGSQSVQLPVGAIHDRGNGPGVWIVDDKSEVKFRSVTIASIGKEEAVVSGGVQAGEKVVALGAHLLHEDQVVNLPKEVAEQFYQARKKLGDEARKLPQGAIGPLLNDEYSDVSFALYSVEAPGMPLRQPTRVAEELRQRVLHVPGVKKVDVVGEQQE